MDSRKQNIRVKRFPVITEGEFGKWHKMNNISEAISIMVGSEPSHFGTFMKFFMTVEEAKYVRDQLSDVLLGE